MRHPLPFLSAFGFSEHASASEPLQERSLAENSEVKTPSPQVFNFVRNCQILIFNYRLITAGI